MFAFSFAACDNYEEPNPTPQTNPQESILKTSDVTVSNQLAAETYDLAALNNNNERILVAQVATTELPDAFEFLADAQISNNGFATSTPVEATVEAGEEGFYNVYVSPDDLQGSYVGGISKGPKAKDIEIRFLLETKVADQVAVVGGPTNFYGPYTLNVLPFPSDLVIENAYYLLGTVNGWSVAKAIKFTHSDADPYDDPVFSIKVDISNDDAANGWWWKIVPQSTYETGDWVSAKDAAFGVETNGDEAASGMLMGRTEAEDCGAGCFKQAGQWLLTINMEELTYAFTSAVDFLYTPGQANGWSQINSQLLGTKDYVNYAGFAMLDPGGFKFSDAPDWDHTNYGDGGEEGKLSKDGGAGNLTVPAAGLYFCKVDISGLTYSTYQITTIGIIGGATPKGWDASTPLTTTDNLVWTGTVTLKGGEFKFRANDDWIVSLGGDLQNLDWDNAPNIASPGEGTYDITLNLSTLPYSATLVKK